MWFQKKKASPPPPAPTNAAPKPAMRTENSSVHTQTVHLLEQRLRKLEEQLADLSAKHPRIHIDNLHVHQPVLENLTFRLDQLDIKELSGSLNLGNNFGAKPNGKVQDEAVDKALQRSQVTKESRQERSEGLSNSSSAHDGPGPERTPTGYRYTPPKSKV
ncbi:spore germination protein GerPC [Paenibacillus oryzisoli]|uniref:Uncharacterized protein n=1 Tax=Paenibacillus oryzisoli TaxID=1850517 RepID=A0A198A856_9BACL|nr:spore germination protein GerPC [Paenibacillus oryzisoli]OAS17138.1 hypothetical protein A8708_02665 [Paenibacillus oryzisoli]